MLCHGHMLLVTLTINKLFDRFTKKNLKKYLKIKKITKKGDKVYVKWKDNGNDNSDNFLNSWIDKKDIVI